MITYILCHGDNPQESGLFLKNVVYNYSEIMLVSFQLVEMGLELSLARLKALAKYAFGMGLAQV